MDDRILQDLPSLSSQYDVTSDQVEAYGADGHILLRQVASAAEVAPYRDAIAAAVERLNTEQRSLEERDTYARAFLQIGDLWSRDEAVKRFTLAQRFAHIAADLMQVAAVRIYHDQALFKEGGGGFTPWHQDEYYWPLDTHQTVTMWMPLVDAGEDMGTMRFASGSHSEGSLGKIEISDESEQVLSRLIADKGFEVFSSGAMEAGDATFHAGWTLHGAPGNHSATMREVMTIIYFADGARVTDPSNKAQQHDLGRWLAGLKPGDLAASALNPIVYSRG